MLHSSKSVLGKAANLCTCLNTVVTDSIEKFQY